MNKLFIIKIGGNVLDNPEQLNSFLKDFASIREPKILIHGGGKIATHIGNQLGIASNYVNGRRITDEHTLDLVTMVYGGLVNKKIVATLQQLHCNAIGITGADGNMIKAVKRPVKDIDYGFVGDIKPGDVNTPLLHVLLKQNTIPVFAPLTHADGKMLNTNADTIASVLSIALSKHFDIRLIFCFEKKGVLHHVEDENSVIRHITQNTYTSLLQQNVLKDGILPKLENAFSAIKSGVKEVLIGEANDLLKNTGQVTEGTLITL
ncbi:acetylglutamate kinase [Chryseotalea sanaruensis]|uniref:Acetylglutamate kinase n=1 Tax=Chryseotalea sanaruensis TaxID=2482724 RepID=A0A401UAE5_9BACT|nr:acetylglutamate kinase [Chryseotalea sanaruensis]GCC51851.1 acetylglutamate kinase [Chryseotalea sanaruensis]